MPARSDIFRPDRPGTPVARFCRVQKLCRHLRWSPGCGGPPRGIDAGRRSLFRLRSLACRKAIARGPDWGPLDETAVSRVIRVDTASSLLRKRHLAVGCGGRARKRGHGVSRQKTAECRRRRGNFRRVPPHWGEVRRGVPAADLSNRAATR